VSCYKRAFVITCYVILAAPEADSRGVLHYRHFAQRFIGCPLHRAVDGTLVDCHGWRKRDNAIGWDNSCFNLNYLSSMYACGAGP
jgi:hypothetical protein